MQRQQPAVVSIFHRYRTPGPSTARPISCIPPLTWICGESFAWLFPLVTLAKDAHFLDLEPQPQPPPRVVVVCSIQLLCRRSLLSIILSRFFLSLYNSPPFIIPSSPFLAVHYI